MKKQYMNEFTRDFLQSREKPRVTENRNADWWMKHLGQRFEAGFVLCLIAFMVVLLTYLIRHHRASAFFPLTEVQLMGETNFTTEQDVEKALNETLPKSLIDANTDDIKNAIMTLPWVTGVEVGKHWPGVLKVSITERNPVMRWGDNQVVDAEGVVFKASTNLSLQATLMQKPMLVGTSDNALDVLQHFDAFAAAFPDYEKIGVKAFVLTPHRSWELKLDNGATVRFGNNFLIPRAKRLANAYRQGVLPDLDKVEEIILTYNQGFSVSWKAGENPDGSDAKSKLIPVTLESI